MGELPLVQARDNSRAVSLGHLSSGFGKVDLNVAWVSLVRVDTSVSAVCAATSLGGLVDDDVTDYQLFSVKPFAISVCLGIFEKVQKELDRLNGPAT